MKMKLEITLHAPSAAAMKLFESYLDNAIQDFNDSGETPSGVWYEKGKLQKELLQSNPNGLWQELLDCGFIRE